MKKVQKKFFGFIVATMVMLQAMSAPGLTLAADTSFIVSGQVTYDLAPADGASVILTDNNTSAFLTDTV